ncbi:MAG: cyclic nucleotide-binding domain-containing protein [Hyphomicrobiales bacterium]
MSLDRDIAILKKVPLFADLTGEQIRLIAFSAEPQRLGDGAVLFREGERAESGYVVSNGTVVVSTAQDEDGELIAGPGSLLGETALLMETERPATAVARGPVEVIRVRRALFQRMMDEYPDIAVRIRDRLAERLRLAGAELSRVELRLTLLGDD